MAVGGFLFVEPKRPKEIDPAKVTPVIERSRHHAHDFVRFAVDADGPPDDVGAAAEPFLPATLTDNHNTIVTRQVFAFAEITTEERLDAQRGKEVGRDANTRSHFGGFTGL